MRVSPLKKLLLADGASLSHNYGVEFVSSVSGFEKEYAAIRDSVGVTDFSLMQKFIVPEEFGIDFLDDIVAGNVAKVRFGRILHTFIANEHGEVISDCYIANNDEEFIVLCENIVDDAEIRDLFDVHGAQDAGCREVTNDYVCISIDGVKSWAVAKELFGSDILGLPYLAIEPYEYDGISVNLFRAGKTSEFGYLLMVEKGDAEKMYTAIKDLCIKNGGSVCGFDIHNTLRLEGRFFNIFAEGRVVKNPLSLGLQWMIDFDKDKFCGSEKIFADRKNGLTHKIIGSKILGDNSSFTVDAKLFNGDECVAVIVAICYSPLLDSRVGLALFDINYAFAGLDFNLGEFDGVAVETVSMPPIIPKSLSVKLDDM